MPDRVEHRRRIERPPVGVFFSPNPLPSALCNRYRSPGIRSRVPQAEQLYPAHSSPSVPPSQMQRSWSRGERKDSSSDWHNTFSGLPPSSLRPSFLSNPPPSVTWLHRSQSGPIFPERCSRGHRSRIESLPSHNRLQWLPRHFLKNLPPPS